LQFVDFHSPSLIHTLTMRPVLEREKKAWGAITGEDVPNSALINNQPLATVGVRLREWRRETRVSLESIEDGTLSIHDGVAKCSSQQPGILAEYDS
jgi:hypothetical protein